LKKTTGKAVLCLLLFDLTPDFLSIHRDFRGRGQTEPNSVAFDGDNRDTEVTFGDHNPFTDFPAENKHDTYLLE